jgi:hypothetical protein
MPNLQIEKEYDDILNELKISLNDNKKNIVQNAIRYVHINKIDPSNIKSVDPSSEIKKLRNDLIAYIKTQEKTKLNPMLEKMTILLDQLYSNNENSITIKNLNDLKKELLSNTHQLPAIIDFLNKFGKRTNDHYTILKDQLLKMEQDQKVLNQIIEQKLSKKLL